MAGDVIATTKCDCGDGGTVEWKRSKGGAVTGKCLGNGSESCGEQRFKKSPNAVNRFLKQIGLSSGTPAPAAAPKSSGGGFDLGKL